MKVKYRLPIIILLVSIVPILILSSVGFQIISDLSSNYYHDLIRNQSIASAKHSKDFYETQSSAISYSANIDTYKDYLTRSALKEDIPQELEKQASKLLFLAQQVNPDVNKAFIADASGSIRLSSDSADVGVNIKSNPAFDNAVNHNEISYSISNDGNTTHMILACPITATGSDEILGSLMREINLDNLNRYVKDLKIGESGYLYILDSKGNTLSHYYDDRIDITENREDKAATNLFAFCDGLRNNTLQSDNGFFEYSLKGQKLLANYEMVPQTDWAVVSVIPVSEMTESARNFNTTMLITAIIVGAGAVFIGLFSARRITKPLERIRNTVASIAGGNLDTKMEYNGKDEFADLHSDIELMAHELKVSYKKLSKSAKTDILTGIPNRMAVYEVMDERFDNTENQAALLLDLDGFKEVNDSLGHDYGDDVLIQVAQILHRASNENILSARLGGDEFFIFISSYQSQSDVTELAQKLLSEINSVREAMGQPVNISASIGIAFASETDVDKSYLMKKADLAMYAIKKSGKSSCQVYDNSVPIYGAFS